MTDPAFAPELYGTHGPFSVHTRWIETEFVGNIAPWSSDGTGTYGEAGPSGRQTVTVEVDGKRLEVTLPATLAPSTAQTPAPRGRQSRRKNGLDHPGTSPAGDALTTPMQGTVIKVAESLKDSKSASVT